MRKKTEDDSHGPSWLDTYADMITLVLTFFVLLFSMSSLDSQKWQLLVTAFQNRGVDPEQIVIHDGSSDLTPGPGLVTPDDGNGPGLASVADPVSGMIGDSSDVVEFDDLYKYLEQYVKENNLQGDIELSKGAGYTFITFRNNIFFDGDSSVLKQQGKQILDVIVDAFRGITDDIGEVRAQGHTARFGAADEPNNTRFNWKLSGDRAAEVIWYIDQYKILDESKLAFMGYGDLHPIEPHDGTAATRARNRRVELFISKKDSSPMNIDQIYEAINGGSGSSSSEGSTP